MRHFLDIADLSVEHLRSIMNEAKALKAERASGDTHPWLSGKQLVMIFEKQSTRTRISFEAGIQQLGGRALMLDKQTSQIGRGESPKDTARVVSRYVDMIMARLNRHEDLLDLAANASVPVINGLTDRSHPCQAMADLMTYEEKRGPCESIRAVWLGDANNVLRSWMQACAKFGFSLTVSVPPQVWTRKGFAPEMPPHARYEPDPYAAVKEADLLLTDTWRSMGDESSEIEPFVPYRLDAPLLAVARPNALVMHCLPAKRGEEITDEVLEGPQSVVFDEAENRLHVQKSIMMWCLGAGHSFA